jgi:hypothetical protein
MAESNITNQQQENRQPAPFGNDRQIIAGGVNIGAVSVEIERAVAEAQGQMTLAKRFPRNMAACRSELLDVCKDLSFAKVAFFSKPVGGQKIVGPSIRFAEECARIVGNIEYGHRELSRSDTKSEVEVYVWDKQSNTRSTRQLTVMHVRDTRDGPKKLRDQSEIDDLIANKASKQVRSRIIAICPKGLIAEALDMCNVTLNNEGKDIPMSQRIRVMTDAFAKMGITVAHLEKYLKHPVSETLEDELVDLRGVIVAIKEGEAASQYFGDSDDEGKATATSTKEKLKETAEKGAAEKTKAGPAVTKRAAATEKKEEPAAATTAELAQAIEEFPDTAQAEPQAQGKETAAKPEEAKPEEEGKDLF